MAFRGHRSRRYYAAVEELQSCSRRESLESDGVDFGDGDGHGVDFGDGDGHIGSDGDAAILGDGDDAIVAEVGTGDAAGAPSLRPASVRTDRGRMPISASPPALAKRDGGALGGASAGRAVSVTFTEIGRLSSGGSTVAWGHSGVGGKARRGGGGGAGGSSGGASRVKSGSSWAGSSGGGRAASRAWGGTLGGATASAVTVASAARSSAVFLSPTPTLSSNPPINIAFIHKCVCSCRFERCA